MFPNLSVRYHEFFFAFQVSLLSLNAVAYYAGALVNAVSHLCQIEQPLSRYGTSVL